MNNDNDIKLILVFCFICFSLGCAFTALIPHSIVTFKSLSECVTSCEDNQGIKQLHVNENVQMICECQNDAVFYLRRFQGD